MALNFNIQGAKEAGYTNTQIKDYLRSQKSDVNFDELQSASDEYARNTFESSIAQNPNLLNDYANYLAKNEQASADSQNASTNTQAAQNLSEDELKARFLQDLSDEYFFDKAKDAKITPKPRDVSKYSSGWDTLLDNSIGQSITNQIGALDSFTLGALNNFSDSIKERNEQLNAALNEHIDYGTQFKDLPDVLKHRLKEQGKILDIFNFFNNYGEEKQYEKMQLERKILKDEITFADLNKEQKDLVSGHSTYDRINDVVGEALALVTTGAAGKVIKYGTMAAVAGKEAYNAYDSFKTDADRQKELKNELLSKEVGYTFKRELEKINNFHASKDVFSITGASNEQKQDYLNAVSQVFGTLGIKEYGVDSKGHIYLSTPQGYAKVEMGFFQSLIPLIDDNKFSIAGAIAGATKGAKAKGFKGMVAGGAAGAFAGGSLDYIVAMNSQEREINAGEMLRHATQEGLLSVVGDVAVAGAVKIIKTTDMSKLAQKAEQIIEYTPFVGFAKRALDGNKTAAYKIMKSRISPAEQESIKELAQSFGGEVKLSQSQIFDLIENKITNPSLKKGAKMAAEVFTMQSQKDLQTKLLSAVRTDKSGNFMAFLIQVANSNPFFNQNLQKLLTDTTANLYSKIRALGFEPTDARDIMRNISEVNKGVRNEKGELVKIGTYEDAIYNVLAKHFDENFKITIEPSKFNAFKRDLESSGVKLKDEPSIEIFEKSIYNQSGVTFEQLANIQKEINQHLSRSNNATYINRAKIAMQNFIKDDIKKGIDDIFKLDSEFSESAKALFDVTMSDYAKLKDLQRLVKDTKILNANKDAQDALENLIKNLSGQGNGKISNLEALTRNIPKENVADFEVSILMGVLEKSMKVIENFGKDELGNAHKIFDSSSFIDEVKKIKGIQSQAAKDFIQIVENWDTLFKNDYALAQTLKKVVTDGLHTSIATTATGLIDRIKLVFMANTFMRLMPEIPFLNPVNQMVQGAAVRYHFKKALQNSMSVSDFKLNLQAKINTSNEINTESKQILAEIKDGIKPAIDGELSALEQRIAKQNAQIQNKELANAWKQEFGLDDINKTYTAKISNEVLNAVQDLQGKSVKLEAGSLIKLDKRERADFLKYIKPTLENPQAVVRQNDNALIFVGDYDNKKFFASVARDENGDFVVVSNAPKTLNNLQNKIAQGGEVLYSKLPELPIIAQSELSAKALNSKAIHETIPQNLSPLQKAQLKKEQMIKDKLEAQKLADEAFNQRMKEIAQLAQYNLEAKTANAGLSINDSGLKIGEKIQMREAGNAGSVSLSDDEIIPTKYAIVKASDLKPQFNSASGLQFRTQADEKTIENIAQNFDPNKIIGRGGFEDLPIIISDGQVISGNHRAKAMQQFTQGKDLKAQINSFYDEFDDYKAVRSLGKAFENEPMKKAAISGVIENAHKTLDDVPQALRQEIEQANNIKPLAEFGENFAEFYKNGKGAIAKLLKEKRGQVASAFEKDGLGEIDLVWGEVTDSKNHKGFGLAHIIQKRTALNGEQEAQKILDLIPQIIQNGELEKTHNGWNVVFDNYILGVNHGWKKDGVKVAENKWIVTSFDNNSASAMTATPSTFTKSGNSTLNAKDNSSTNLNNSRDKYTQAIKERLGIELKDDELLVRIADIDETTQAGQRTIINLAMASNANRAGKVGDVFVSALGKYDKNIQNLPRILGDEADNVEQLKYIVARELDKNAQYPNIEEANKALFASLAKSTSSKNMAEALNIAKDILKNDEAGFAKLSQMLTDNAGNFRNLVNNIADMGYKNLEVRPYLTDAIIHTAKNLDEGTRKVNIQNLVTNLEADIANANANGGIVQNLFGENKKAFNDYISEALGVALARFVRLENPSANLFEFFKSLEKDLYEKAQPDFFNMNKTPDDINIIDFITILLEKGQITESVQKLGASLETLREPYAQFLKSVNKNAQKAGDKLGENAVVSKMERVENPTAENFSEVGNETQIFDEFIDGGALLSLNKDLALKVIKDKNFNSLPDRIKQRLETQLYIFKNKKAKQAIDKEYIPQNAKKLIKNIEPLDFIQTQTNKHLQQAIKELQSAKDSKLISDLELKQAQIENKDLESYIKDNAYTDKRLDFEKVYYQHGNLYTQDGTKIKRLYTGIDNQTNSVRNLIKTISAFENGLNHNHIFKIVERENINDIYYSPQLIFKQPFAQTGESIRLDKVLENSFGGNYKDIKEYYKLIDEAYKQNNHPFGIRWNGIEDKNLKGKEAVDFLLDVESGYIENAFKKQGLGDIDLVWGDSKFGLGKIFEKHSGDFESFAGKDSAEKIGNALNEIVTSGELISKNGVNTIILKKDNKEFRIGLSKGWDNKGENNWIITAYEFKDSNKTSNDIAFTSKQPLENLENNSSTKIKLDDGRPSMQAIPENASKALKAEMKEWVEHFEQWEKRINEKEAGEIVTKAYRDRAVENFNYYKNLEQILEQTFQNLPKMQQDFKQQLAKDVARNKNFGDVFLRNFDESELVKFNLKKDEQGNFTKASFAKIKADIKKDGEITNYLTNKLLKAKEKNILDEAQKYGVQLKNAQKADDDILYKLSSKDIQKLEAKEKQNLKDLVDGKIKSVVIRKDLENIDEAILLEKGSKNKGFTHIKFRHLKNEQKEGFVKDDEILNLGIDIRKYLAKHKEPYTDKDGARLYEWQNEQGNKFRVVVSGGSADSLPATNSTTETIITFYSDRNAKTPMDFKNPRVELEKEILEFENAKNRWGLESAYYSLERANRDKNYIAQKLVDEAKQKYYAYLHLAYKNKGKFENPKKFFDLLEWHKDSHPFTKNGAMEYNTPKTFYHGSGEKFSIFEQDNSGFGYFFSTNKQEAKDYKGEAGRLNSVFLNIKNPFRADEIKINSFDDYKKWQEFLMPNARFHKGELEKSYKSFLDDKEFFQGIKNRLEKNRYKLSETNGTYINAIKGDKYYRFNLGARSWDMKPHEEKVFGDLIRKYEKEAEHPAFKKYEWVRNEFDLFRFNIDFFDQVGEYQFGKENFKELLQSKGYDGIIFNDFQVSVFDSKQIKEISNRGKGGKYFDGENPNIYYKQQADKITQNLQGEMVDNSKLYEQNLKAGKANKPLEVFGENNPRLYHAQNQATDYLLDKKQGQVVGAYHRDDLGDIDLVWGQAKIDKGDIQGLGLEKVLVKHAQRNEFESFGGSNAQEQMKNAIDTIISRGFLFAENGTQTLWLKNADGYFKAVLQKGFKGEGKNNWLLTTYKKEKGKIPSEVIEHFKGDTANLSAYSDKFNPPLTSGDEPLNLNKNNSTTKTLDLSSEQNAKELSELFAQGADSTNAQIFEKVAKVAQDFGVKVEFAPKLSHESAMGEFEKGKNIVRVRSDLGTNEQSETILHELIHASTIKAIDNIDNLNAKQMQAVTKLREIYENTKANNPNPPREIEHALSNFKEFVAELSNPALRQELKAQNLLEKIADVILEFFNLAGLSDVSKAKKALMDLLDSESAQAGLDKDARRIYDLKLESLEKAGLEPPTPSGEASKQSQSHKNTSGESNAPFEINSNPSTNNAKISNKEKVKNRILEKKINKLEATKQRLQSAQAIQKLDEIIQKHKSNLAAQGVRLGIKQDLASGEN